MESVRFVWVPITVICFSNQFQIHFGFALIRQQSVLFALYIIQLGIAVSLDMGRPKKRGCEQSNMVYIVVGGVVTGISPTVCVLLCQTDAAIFADDHRPFQVSIDTPPFPLRSQVCRQSSRSPNYSHPEMFCM